MSTRTHFSAIQDIKQHLQESTLSTCQAQLCYHKALKCTLVEAMTTMHQELLPTTLRLSLNWNPTTRNQTPGSYATAYMLLSKQGATEIVVHSPDTDVLVLLVHHCQTINCEVVFAYKAYKSD
ncbi:hypothetical protein GWK47_022581 [Chionoecetes opilio]|uniref:Uncharacterized protein n=1 Tax=Chionoecetes opilio TaxID=41210 RepID=A0A8J5CFE8_CHIOP|nr:hypothetical protein GWK47_022581 [Chionoecetes opilio]